MYYMQIYWIIFFEWPEELIKKKKKGDGSECSKRFINYS